MEQQKVVHLLTTPWTGLGLYGGFRGNRWLKNRIKVFKQFVVPSLQNQRSKNFILVCNWRSQERKNPYVQELMRYMEGIQEFKTIHTFSGILFYDDKYEDWEARDRLIMGLHGALGELTNVIGECDEVLMTIQPSDDLYDEEMVEAVQGFFQEHPDFQALGFRQGYICNYQTKEVAEYGPNTSPPFYTIKFPRDVFVDPLKHVEYTALKSDVGKYKKGTPIPSHEYVGDALKYAATDDKGFMVGTHGENISTHWNHPFKGRMLSEEEAVLVLANFGIQHVEPLKLPFSLRRWVLKRLPHSLRRKLRYWWAEKLYNFIRS